MKSVYWEPSCCMRTDGGTDRRTDMTKLIIAFRNFANAPQKVITCWLRWISWEVSDWNTNSLGSQCTYNVTEVTCCTTMLLRQMYNVTEVKCCTTMFLREIYNVTEVKCCTTMLLRQIYIACNNKIYVDLKIKCKMLRWNKRIFLCSRPLDLKFVKQIVKTGKELHSFSIF
jgi:hypothetical protein